MFIIDCFDLVVIVECVILRAVSQIRTSDLKTCASPSPPPPPPHTHTLPPTHPPTSHPTTHPLCGWPEVHHQRSIRQHLEIITVRPVAYQLVFNLCVPDRKLPAPRSGNSLLTSAQWVTNVPAAFVMLRAKGTGLEYAA